MRHVSFESAAGFLHSKGLFKDGVFEAGTSSVDPNGESSDEEFFNSNPVVPSDNHTPLVPETEEDFQELEYLMKRISEYNAKLKK